MKSYHVTLLIKIAPVFLLFVSVVFGQEKQEIKLAESYVRSGNHEAALFIFQKLYRDGNSQPRVINGISKSLQALHRIDELIKFLHEVVSHNPGIFSYEIDLANAYFLNKQNDLARNLWQRVYETKPPNLMRYRLVAQAMTRFRLFDEAIDVYKKAMTVIRNQQAMHLDIGTLYRVQLNYEKAVEHYIAYFRRFKKQRGYIRSLLVGMAKDDEAADRIINTLESLNADKDADINELLANLYIRKKEYNRAFEIIKTIEESTAGSRYVYLTRFAVEAEKDKAYEYVIKAYEYVIKKNSGALNASNKLKLAEAYYNFGNNLFKETNDQNLAEQKIKKSISILQNLLKDKSPEKYFSAELLADIYKNYYNDLDKSLDYYGQVDLKTIGLNNADKIRLKVADVHILKNDLLQARKIYETVKTKKYGSYALYNLAELNYFTGQFKKAVSQYQQLVSSVGMKNNLANNGLGRIFNIEQYAADSVSFASFAAADLLKRQKKYSEAAKEFSEIYYENIEISPQAAIEAVNLYKKLDKTEEVIALLEDRLETFPNDEANDQVLFLLAGSYQKQGNDERALTYFQHLLNRFPTSFYTEKAREKARDISRLMQDNINP